MAWLRTFRQRFGIAAPRVAVRAHVPWYWRWLGIACAGALATGVGWAISAGMIFPDLADAHGRTLARLDETVARQEAELGRLRGRAAQAERQLAIENAVHTDLVRQIKALTEQNAALKEDLAFFQTLIAAASGTRDIIVERFRLQPATVPGEYRYRLFLVKTGPREKDFEGRLQLVVNLVEAGRARVLTLPPDGEREAREYQLKFKFFQRIEGSFRVTPGASVKSIQVRVYQPGSRAPKLAHTVNAS